MHGKGPGTSLGHVSEWKERSISLSQIVVLLQGEGNEEGSWLLHNAMRDADGVAYHPECFKEHSRKMPQTSPIITKMCTIFSGFSATNSL